MAIDQEVFSQTLKHKGYFTYSEFYSYCFDWLKDEGFKVVEDEYVEKVSSGGKEIHIKWKFSKKVSDYVKHKGIVSFDILGLTDEEVIVEGKKRKTNKADLKIKISASLEKDYDSHWDKTPRLKLLRGVYDRYIIKATLDQYGSRLEGKAVKFVDDVKSYLNLAVKQ